GLATASVPRHQCVDAARRQSSGCGGAPAPSCAGSRARRLTRPQRRVAASADPSRRLNGHLMDPFAFPPLALLLDTAYGGLAGLIDLLAPIAGATAAATAVILVTILVRALLVPVGVSQAKAEQMRARLAPKLRA